MKRIPALIPVLIGLLSLPSFVRAVTLEITLDPAVASKPVTGRLLVGIEKGSRPPRFTNANPPTSTILAVDVDNLAPGKSVKVDSTALTFPEGGLERLADGSYTVQAILMTNRDRWVPSAEGNLRSKPLVQKFPAKETIAIRLDQVIEEAAPTDTATHKYFSIPSKLLSAFHGRPMQIPVAVVLPVAFASETKNYALLVQIGGFGSTRSSARRVNPDPRFVQLVLDGVGPLGDPYYVNSANNGPYGDALVQEVIPEIEKRFRGMGTPQSRFTTGASTGGWVSFALQVFYPDFFNGCWSQCPDPVDFRSYQLIDIYSDANAYKDGKGVERSAARTLNGASLYTVRHECQLERILGRGGNWELGGQQWASWNAVFGPKGANGLPVPLWDATGKIDPTVAKQYEKYDLQLVLERNWGTLGPKLAGKVHIWVGDSDDYYLNLAVHKLKAMLDAQTAPRFDGQILIEPGKGHSSGGWRRQEMLNTMAKRAGS